MTYQHCFTSIPLMALSLVFGQMAAADYIADFDSTGSAADFASFANNATDDGDPSGTGDNTDFFIIASGDSALRVQASPPAGGSGGGAAQLRYQVAPVNAAAPGLSLPVGSSNDSVRTEARLSVKIEEIVPGDGVGGAQTGILENPFMEFGLAEFDPATSTADYANKVIVQIDNAFNAGVPGDPHILSLGYTINNAGAGTTTISNFDLPGDAFSSGAIVELHLTEAEAKVLYNGTDLGFVSLPANFFANNFDAGNELIPFFGVIRGPALEDDDVVAVVFDDISSVNVAVVPEPTTMLLGSIAGLCLTLFRKSRVRSRVNSNQTF